MHDIEHKVKSLCSLIFVMFGLVSLQLTLWIPSTKCDSGVFVLFVVMFGLALLQLTQWVSSTKYLWWSNFFS